MMFDDEDADGLMIPHNDALVISLLVHDTSVKWVLIDPCSLVNIILLRVVNEMQATDKVIPKAWSSSGFDNSSVVTKGEVVMATFAEGVIKDRKFQVIDVVPSTLHKVIKFPSLWGIRLIRGDQQASQSINSVVIANTTTNDADLK
ncbi:uncharacterized protein [Nicotiana tomentosiformis]|uniref:uncharacterized protein n=1 Tax=Nicotiana tomentosiformis TaxID=4098 RepID=UPI00388CE948